MFSGAYLTDMARPRKVRYSGNVQRPRKVQCHREGRSTPYRIWILSERISKKVEMVICTKQLHTMIEFALLRTT